MGYRSLPLQICLFGRNCNFSDSSTTWPRVHWSDVEIQHLSPRRFGEKQCDESNNSLLEKEKENHDGSLYRVL